MRLSMAVEVALPDVCKHLGEGPHWDQEDKKLLFVDIHSQLLNRWDPITNTHERLEVDDEVSVIVPRKSGGYIIGKRRKIAHLDWDTNTTTTLQEIDNVGPDDKLNDGKCDAVGRFWVGSIGSQNKPGYAVERASLYKLDHDGSLNKALDRVTMSNGIAWSQDNRTMFFIDSVPARKIFAFDYDIAKGTISNQRTAVDIDTLGDMASYGLPDGMTIDTNGHLWVACYNSGKIKCFDPEIGKDIRTIDMPVPRVTSCCFGGQDLNEMYVTCGTAYASETELKTYPLYGSLFRITGLGVKGLPANGYAG